MEKSNQSVLLFVFYSILIFGTMYVSGRVSELNLYDRFIVDFDGVIIPVQDYEKAVDFYSNVLNFTPLVRTRKGAKKIIGFQISSYRRLYLEPASKVKGAGSSIIVVRVRNGFEELHSQLVVRSEKPIQRADRKDYLALDARGVVTRIVDRPWGKEFAVYDHEGNRVVFANTKRRSIYRKRKGATQTAE